LRSIAVLYAVIVLLAAVWALTVDAHFLNPGREHLLPDVLLAFIAMPASLSIGPLYDHWPTVFGNEFAQVAWAAACGFTQALLLFMAGRLWARRRSAA